ncbi:MAG: OprO/OprP family phosphate-selective porin [Aquisalimonadaceae bacterium]
MKRLTSSFSLPTSLLILLPAATATADFELHGRFHLDYAIHSEDRSDLGNQFLLRRARLGVEGDIANDWSYRLEADFAENVLEAKNVYVSYDGWRNAEVTLGHFKVPFGLEQLTSSDSMTFVERSLPSEAFTPSRRIGLGLETSGGDWLAQAMVFGQEVGAEVRNTDADEGMGIGGRLVFSPSSGERGQWHFGVAASTEQPASLDLRQTRFRSYPESRPTGVRLVDTGNINNVRWITRLGLEAAWESGPYSAQWEYIQADLDRRSGSSDPGFNGWYLSGSWVLTGESRRYRDGRFRSVRPDGDSGAWELAARFSSIDLDDRGIQGGTEKNLALGVNWYLNDQLRFMLNAIFIDSEGPAGDDNPTILLARTQLTF